MRPAAPGRSLREKGAVTALCPMIRKSFMMGRNAQDILKLAQDLKIVLRKTYNFFFPLR